MVGTPGPALVTLREGAWGLAGHPHDPSPLLVPVRRSAARRVFRGVCSLLSSLVLVVSVGGWLSSAYLNGNIRRSALFLGHGSQGTEKKDSAGRAPMNILVLGSDTRDTAADCAIGGGCGVGGNADVEMVVHLAANRTNATVMSIPRDTITDIPACTDPTSGHVYPATSQVQINGSLQHGGPGCTVAAVHALTGITIDHFIMVDFSGVVNMSDAVGGVNVCVNNNVYDTYSGLKLSKGTHTLKGIAALEFLRTRHGFGNGGDVGREAAQHVFLSALVQKLKTANTLTNPVAVYHLATAATKALTVDTGLAGVSPLVALAGQLNDVPTNRITFLTMPNVPYPANPNWLSPAPTAPAVFQAIADDQSFSTGPAPTAPAGGTRTATRSPTPIPSVDPGTVPVAVDNGSRYTGRAAALTAALRQRGYLQALNDGNGPTIATTRLTYPAGDKTAAQALAATLGLPATTLSVSATTNATVRLQIGADWPAGTRFPGAATTASSGSTTPPPAANALNAANAAGCVAVSTQDTTQFGSPIRAYALNPQKPNSAP